MLASIELKSYQTVICLPSICLLDIIRRWSNGTFLFALCKRKIECTFSLQSYRMQSKADEMAGLCNLQRTMEAFLIILSATQLVYILAIHGGISGRR